jgi:hypothetical protein
MSIPYLAILAEKYMLFKVSNNLVQIYLSFSITGNYGRRSFSKYGISYYKLMSTFTAQIDEMFEA